MIFQEFVVPTRAKTLRGWHQDAWRAVHGPHTVDGGRDFQFHFDDQAGKLVIRVLDGSDRKGAIRWTLPESGCRFMVRVHAVKRLKGKRERPLSTEEMPDWMAQRMGGFAIQEMQVSPLAWYPMSWNAEGMATRWVTGQAGIKDADAANATLSRGIGRARGFGLGMVMLLPLHNQ